MSIQRHWLGGLPASAGDARPLRPPEYTDTSYRRRPRELISISRAGGGQERARGSSPL